MSARMDVLTAICEAALCDGLPAALKDAIRDAVRGGAGKRDVMAAVARAAGGRRSLTYLGCGAWCDRMLREYA